MANHLVAAPGNAPGSSRYERGDLLSVPAANVDMWGIAPQSDKVSLNESTKRIRFFIRPAT